jgi:extracellular elastinolytic metalloproteinase
MALLPRAGLSIALLPVLLLAAAAPAHRAEAQGFDRPAARYQRNLDARPGATGPACPVDLRQQAAIDRFRARLPGLVVERDAATGALRSVANRHGYLTPPAEAAALAPRLLETEEELRLHALGFVSEELDLLGLVAGDLAEIELVLAAKSRWSGLTHLRFAQRFEGLPVYNAELRISVEPDGRILGLHNQLVPRLAAGVNRTEPAIDSAAAVRAAVRSVESFAIVRLPAAGIRLALLPFPAGGARLVWNFQLESGDGRHLWDLTVDAESARVWTRIDWVAEGLGDARYKIYAPPVESPNHTTPSPPADGRAIRDNPWDPTASPFGWHDTNGVAGADLTFTAGNNAHACTDVDGSNTCDANSAPDGGDELDFQFPIALLSPPAVYGPATVTNVFYWTNYLHDLFYLYGFDEAAGNFQQNNYGRGGEGSDYVRAEVRNAGCSNSSFFTTPADGVNPRMELCLGTAPSPDVDGGLDNGMITHEYSHGVSRRLTGVSCLANDEQMGEGWGDFFALAVTARAGDSAAQSRGFGTYLFGQPSSGPGIRPAPYTTSLAVNGFTYADLPGLSIPHGVGFLWASMLWDLYWRLVEEDGFNPDLFEPHTTGGNNLALQLVVGGLALQPCSPGFVDARSAILAADVALTGGDNECRIWESFAQRGLGYSSSQGLPQSTTDGAPGFDTPPHCPAIFLDGFETGSTVRWGG